MCRADTSELGDEWIHATSCTDCLSRRIRLPAKNRFPESAIVTLHRESSVSFGTPCGDYLLRRTGLAILHDIRSQRNAVFAPQRMTKPSEPKRGLGTAGLNVPDQPLSPAQY
jgi:hypothetical protein